MRPGRAAAAAASCIAVASCAPPPTGPIVGHWRGTEPTIAVAYTTTIELVLEGPPGSTSGTYDYGRAAAAMGGSVGERNITWSNHWEMHPVTVNGQPMLLVHLSKLVGGYIPDFLLTPGNVMVPQPNVHHFDLSKTAYRVALYPVQR